MPAWFPRLLAYGRTLLRFLAAIQRAEEEVAALRAETVALDDRVRALEGRVSAIEPRWRQILAGKDTNYDGDAPR